MTAIDSNERGGRAIVPLAPAEELRRAAAKLRETPDREYGEQLANWLEHAGDNMSDEDAHEVIRDRPDGTTYREVLIDGDCHLGLPSEWTAALQLARAINAVADPVPEPVVSDDARKILEGLNQRLIGLGDPEAGIDWAIRQPEVGATEGPNAEGEFLVELYDGTSIELDAAEKRWVVTVSDDESTDSPVGQLSGEVSL